MNRLEIILIGTLIAVSFYGCMNITGPRYSVSVDNAQELKRLEGAKARMVSIKPGVHYNNSCRGTATVQAPDGMTVPQYVEKAFNDELKNSGIYDPHTGAELSGVMLQMEFSSTANLTGGWWALGMKLASSNTKSMLIQSVYYFDSSFEGGMACTMTAQALMPAVQDFIRKTITDPKFNELLR